MPPGAIDVRTIAQKARTIAAVGRAQSRVGELLSKTPLGREILADRKGSGKPKNPGRTR